MVFRKLVFPAALTAGLLGVAAAQAADVKPIPPEQSDRLHRMIRVQPEEQRFWRIPWKLSIGEARQQAAAERLT